MHGSVTIEMNATPAEVWSLVTDVTRIGEFSPETFEGEWLDGATGPAVGATFRGHVKRNGRGPTYWTTCRVLTCEPEREFSFGVLTGKNVVNTWGYRLEPTADRTATSVTEFFELTQSPPMKVYWALAGRWRGKTNEDGMRTTLERIKAVVEAPPAT
jgi:uncharacterized protein YndB with AHSA1/START domain